jgi:hypothetical protein
MTANYERVGAGAPLLRTYRRRSQPIEVKSMGCISKSARGLAVVLCFVCAWPSAAAAQERDSLKIPTIAASIAAAGDWASTYHALRNYHLRESNPLLRPFDSSPSSVVALGSVIDAGALSAWNMTVGRRSTKAAAIGLWGMAAFRTFLVIHNVRNMQRAAKR